MYDPCANQWLRNGRRSSNIMLPECPSPELVRKIASEIVVFTRFRI